MINKQLMAVIIGGLVGGTFGTLIALIGFWNTSRQQKKGFAHESEENRIRFLREIGKERILAYKTILSEIELLQFGFTKAAENGDINHMPPILENFMRNTVPHLILVSESVEKELQQFFVDILLLARSASGPGSYREILKKFSDFVRPLTVMMRDEIAVVEKTFSVKIAGDRR